MIGVVVCAHGGLAEELLSTARLIVQDFPAAVPVAVRPGDGPDEVRERLDLAIKEVDQGDGVVLLCDMFGGTPSNLSLSFLGPSIEVVTGVNLPLLLRLHGNRTGALQDVATDIQSHGRSSVLVASELLRPRGRDA